ncbi:MAG: hypothetical protein KTR17_02115 [Cellvibrionaceae bacterium]|nr:hypothetical protein [Cellvibrionaceae bacterium]
MFRKMFTVKCIAKAIFLSSLTLEAFAFGNNGGGGGGEDNVFAEPGDFDVVTEPGGRDCTIFRPEQLGDDHAVVIWGNGTGASPNTYAGLLRHYASHGFVVVAANTSNAGTGEDMLNCLDFLEGSQLASSVDFSKVGATGHSQGGGGAIMAGVDPRIATTAPIEGFTLGLGHDRDSHDQQNGPMLILSGSADRLVNPRTNHAPLFDATNVPAFWAIAQGAGHFEPVGDGGDFRGISTAWFLFQLEDDPEATTHFVGDDCFVCEDPGFDVEGVKEID